MFSSAKRPAGAALLRTPLRRQLAALAALTTFACPLAAQPAGAEGDNFLYYVQARDTLGELSQRFIGNTQRWNALAAENGVTDALRLPIGKLLRIPLDWIPRQPANATLTYARGNVQVDGQPGTAGQALASGTRITTGNSSGAALTLPDGGFVSLPSDSQITLNVLQEFRGTGLLDSVIKLDNGDLETQVSPQHQGVGRFEVHTPVTITGVRGTRFRVRMDDDGVANEVLDGKVRMTAEATNSGDRNQQIAAGYGSRVAPDGTVSPVVPLPPAPVLRDSRQEGGQWIVDFDAVPQAVSYLVQVSLDEAGTEIVERQTLAAPPLRISQPLKRYYASVISVNQQGLRGPAASIALTGNENALVDTDGQPILTSFDGIVQLQAF